MNNYFIKQWNQVVGLSKSPAFGEKISFKIFFECLLDVKACTFQIACIEKNFNPLDFFITNSKPVFWVNRIFTRHRVYGLLSGSL